MSEKHDNVSFLSNRVSSIPACAAALLLILFLSAGEAAALSNGGGTWPYSRDITITNPGAALSDYQVLVSLDSSNFPAGAQDDGDDVRFTDAGGAELSYWIESWDYAGKSANVWMKVANW